MSEKFSSLNDPRPRPCEIGVCVHRVNAVCAHGRPGSTKVWCSEKTLTHADHHTTGERPPSTLIAVPVM
jgi:hypothetical protein